MKIAMDAGEFLSSRTRRGRRRLSSVLNLFLCSFSIRDGDVAAGDDVIRTSRHADKRADKGDASRW